MILVVGATGQLGSLVVERLREAGTAVRAMVRDPGTAQDIAATGAELVTADLRHEATLDAALDGIETVVATANVVAPTRPGDTTAALDAGYRALVARATDRGVRRFLLASIPVSAVDGQVPVARGKRQLEGLLADSGLSYAAIRFPPFIEVWLALVGSALPLDGESRPTLERPYGFLRTFRRLTGRTVERHGVMLVPGRASARNAFISVRDVARLMAAAVDEGTVSGCVEIGGPEILSWQDVAAIFGRVLDRRVRVIGTPAAAFAVPQRLLAPLAPSVSDILGLNRFMAASETPWETADVADRLGVTGMRTVEQVLREKAALPAPV
jgi:uncharacterized protein YbjT (DUF2867 family)